VKLGEGGKEMFILFVPLKKVLQGKINFIAIIHATGVQNCKKSVTYD
jgi:hypothetical protein